MITPRSGAVKCVRRHLLHRAGIEECGPLH
jgi:hypothetical protein